MKINFYIHGVPKGQEIWGSEQDRDYIKSFYSVSYNENVRFLIEVIPAKKKIFYTYLRCNNVYGSENRKGSYFGITISFDGVFCTDNGSLYTLFEQIFNHRIVGLILLKQGENYRFSNATLDNQAKELEQIKNLFVQQLDSFNDDFESIDNSFVTTSNGQTAFYNTNEVDSSIFFSTLKKTLKISVSPEYPTKDNQIATLKKQVEPERLKNKQLSDENAQLKQQLDSANATNKRYFTELTQLKTDKQKVDDENKNLRADNASLKTELERNKAKSSIERSVTQIRQPLEDLLKGVRKLTPNYHTPIEDTQTKQKHHQETDDNKNKKIHMIAIDSIIILMFLSVIALTSLTVYNTDFTKIFPKKENKNTPTKVTTPKRSDVKISGFRGTELETDKEYTAELINPPTDRQLKWRIDGAEATSEKNDCYLKFKPLVGKDTVYLTCCVVINNMDSVIQKTLWPIKKP